MGNVGLDYLFARFVSGVDQELMERHHLWFGSFGPLRHKEILAPRVLETLGEDDPFASARACMLGEEWADLDRLLHTDFTMYLQDGLLTKVDRSTMLASLEARAPYLDHELVEFVAGLPPHYKLSGFTTKAILRRAERKRLPAGVVSRRKRGFNIPFSRWLLRGLAAEMRARFSPGRVEARGLLSPVGVGRLLEEHLERRADNRKPLFTLLALDLWCDRFFGDRWPVPLGGVGIEEAALHPVVS
jgi:asparagine synthase (glutamine-hydrolysing)